MTSAAPAQFAAPTPSGAAAAAMGIYDRRYLQPLDTSSLWGNNNSHPFARHDGSSSSGGAMHMQPAVTVAAPAQFAMAPAPEEDIKFDSRQVLQQQQVEDDDDAPPPQEAPSSDSFDGGHDAARPRDKTQRRLAQNREAARKSRLRKKAYIQNLETSRIKLAQLEQELNRTRQQCAYMGGSNSVGLSAPIVDSGVAAFEVEYARWVEEQGRQARELRAALHGGAPEFQLRVLVEAALAHYDELFTAKSAAARSDAFFVTSGAWRTAAERLFLWIGGFRPSDLLRALSPRLEPATEQQQAAVHGLQLKARQVEDALSHGLDRLQQTLAESLLHTDAIGSADGDAGGELARMAGAMGRLESLAGFVDQADHLRQQTLQNMRKILTPRQAAQGLVALADYCQRLRALSALWAARPREPA